MDIAELRQKRSAINKCENSNIGVYVCPDEYSVFTTEDSSFGPKSSSAWEYGDIGHKVSIIGQLNFYSLDGFSAELPVRDEAAYFSQVNELKANNWIDHGTRAVFYSINLFDPNNGVNITLVTFVEMSVT